MKSFAGELWRRGPWLVRVGLAHALLLLVLLLLMLVDERQILGVNIWLKPAKFAASISVFLLTMAWLLGELPRPRALITVAVGVILASMCLEQILITMQAARETTSHYNAATWFDDVVFSLMGFGVAANSAAVALILLLFLARSDRERPAYCWGIRLGLFVFLLGSVQGFMMIASFGHTVGAPDGGPGIPIFGWSTVAGDLRIAHFIGIHAIQVLPLTGWLLDRCDIGHRWRVGGIVAVSVLYAGYGLLALAAALRGQTWFAFW